MPLPDVETPLSVRVCGGQKIACETLAESAVGFSAGKPVLPDGDSASPSDLPPESFFLPKDAEMDWLSRKVFYERKESTRGGCGPPKSSSNSQIFSLDLNSTAAILRFPNTNKKKSHADAKRRSCRSSNIRLFPKRPESVWKSTVPVAEPSSPKVSCIGRVRSMRGLKKSSEQDQKKGTPAEKHRSGLSSCLTSFLRCRRGKPIGPDTESSRESAGTSPARNTGKGKAKEIPRTVEPVGGAPGLGDVRRLASGRRSWSVEDIEVARS